MINWQYIKGLNEAATGDDQPTPRNAETLYTFLYFKRNSTSNFGDFEFVPGIAINDYNSFNRGENHDYGHIITQKAINQHIDSPFTFATILKFAESATSYTDACTLHYDSTNDNLDFGFVNDNDDLKLNWNSTNKYLFKKDYFDFAIYGTIQQHLNIGNYLKVGNATLDSPVENGSIYVANKVQAKYFNATSDRRAKDNLKILNFKALDLINHTNLYSFTYKDTNISSIGIIAQDVQDINIEGFKLVDNENATGQNMDYMSIHESKLVYILWKAIQEQQKEIEELKKRLN